MPKPIKSKFWRQPIGLAAELVLGPYNKRRTITMIADMVGDIFIGHDNAVTIATGMEVPHLRWGKIDLEPGQELWAVADLATDLEMHIIEEE